MKPIKFDASNTAYLPYHGMRLISINENEEYEQETEASIYVHIKEAQSVETTEAIKLGIFDVLYRNGIEDVKVGIFPKRVPHINLSF